MITPHLNMNSYRPTRNGAISDRDGTITSDNGAAAVCRTQSMNKDAISDGMGVFINRNDAIIAGPPALT